MDELVRDGARQMLAAAMQAEVAAYIEQFTDVLDEDGHRLGPTHPTTTPTNQPRTSPILPEQLP